MLHNVDEKNCYKALEGVANTIVWNIQKISLNLASRHIPWKLNIDNVSLCFDSFWKVQKLLLSQLNENENAQTSENESQNGIQLNN